MHFSCLSAEVPVLPCHQCVFHPARHLFFSKWCHTFPIETVCWLHTRWRYLSCSGRLLSFHFQRGNTYVNIAIDHYATCGFRYLKVTTLSYLQWFPRGTQLCYRRTVTLFHISTVELLHWQFSNYLWHTAQQKCPIVITTYNKCGSLTWCKRSCSKKCIVPIENSFTVEYTRSECIWRSVLAFFVLWDILHSTHIHRFNFIVS